MSLEDLQALPHSPAHAITSALFAAIAADPLLSPLPLSRNPRRAAQLGDGPVVLVLKEVRDGMSRDPGAAELRQREVSLGVVCRATGADALADKVYHYLHIVAYDALSTLQQSNADVRSIKEIDTRYEVEDIEIDGAIVIGTWSVNYRYRRPIKRP